MKNLATIQKISKVINVLIKIAFVFSIVAASLCLAGITWLLVGTAASLGDGFISLFISGIEEMTISQALCLMLIILTSSISGIIIFASARAYMTEELKSGTPFTAKGAKMLKNTGLVAIITTCAMSLVTVTIYGIFNNFSGHSIYDGDGEILTIVIGAGLIVLSLIFDYGAELQEKLSKQKVEKIADNQ